MWNLIVSWLELILKRKKGSGMLLTNKVVLITGGAGLIGQEFIRAVIEEGGVAILGDIDLIKGQQVKASIEKELNTDRIEFVELDIA